MYALPPDIAAILAFSETGAQFFERVQQERVYTGLRIIDDNVSLRPGVVLEVAGPAGSGKTELLLSIALHALLAPYAVPDTWLPASAATAASGRAASPSGPGSSLAGAPAPAAPSPPHRQHKPHVVLLDLDGKFDGVRLMQVLEAQVHSAWRDQQQQHLAVRQQQQQQQRLGVQQRASGPGPPLGVGDPTMVGPTGSLLVPGQLLSPDQVVAEVLSRLHLVQCHSSLQLLAALMALPARVEAMQREGGCCQLLLVDNVGAHYWRDRAARNVTAPGGPRLQHQHAQPLHPHAQHQPMPHPQQQQQPLALSLFEMHAAIAARLAHVSRRLRLAVVASKMATVTARAVDEESGVGGAPWRGEGPVQLQQREFMPMPWQNIITHRMLLYPRGAVPGPLPPTAAASQCPPPTLTAILAAMLGPAGAGLGAHGVAGWEGRDAVPLHGIGQKVAQLLVSAVAMVEEW